MENVKPLPGVDPLPCRAGRSTWQVDVTLGLSAVCAAAFPPVIAMIIKKQEENLLHFMSVSSLGMLFRSAVRMTRPGFT